MIAEFGVEPEVLAEWRHFQSLWGDFGVAQRRQIGLYPKKWKRETIDRAHALIREGRNTEMQVKKMVERMTGDGAKAKFRKTDCSDWNERPWLENAIEHRPTFDAIIAAAAPEGSGALVAGEFLRDEPPYAREPNVSIPRTVADLVGAAWPLIARAEAIVLVEPNFDPTEPRFLNPLIHLIERLQESGAQPKRFELHTCKFRRLPAGDRLSRVRHGNYRDRVSPHMPAGWKLDVCFWAETLPEHHLHARFVLTEVGGIHYDNGLDVGEPGSTTLISGLGEAAHREIFALYSLSGAAFRSDRDNESFAVT